MNDSLYKKAKILDDAYDKAIKKQFGRHATRWTVKLRDFNPETKKVYQKRLAIIEQYLAQFKNN